MLPESIMPPALDFSLNLFESNAQVENKTNETLYITPVTTTYGDPRVITQFDSVRQRDFPLSPDQSMSLTYDAADMPLSGIAVCNAQNECKLLPVDNSNRYEITSLEDLPELDASWLSAIQSYPKNSYGVILISLFSFLPILLFADWLYLTWLERKQKVIPKAINQEEK